MTVKNIRRGLKDKYFDIPFSHVIKNNILSLISKGPKEQTKNKIRTHRNFYVMSKKPMIIFTCEEVHELHHFSKIIKMERSATFFKLFQWTLFDTPWVIDKVIRDYHFQKQNFPNHKIIFLLNTLDEYNALKLRGLQCEYINQNCLIDPKIFYPINSPKKFDCIYNGRFELLKRHYLLEKCDKTSLISAPILRMDKNKKSYINQLKGIIPTANILNYNSQKKFMDFNPEDSIPQLSPSKVNEYINLSKVGLILSYKEGACYAAVEYLLAGLPVISSRSLGGRDVFFDKRFCRIVPSNKHAVSNAVRELIRSNIDPNFIRSEVLKKIKPHINRLKNLILIILNKEGANLSDVESLWEKKYINKMQKYAQPFPDSFNDAIN